MVSSSSRENALGRQIMRASRRAAVSPVAHSRSARSCCVFSRLAMARSLPRFTPWSSPCFSLTARAFGSSSAASSASTSATVVSGTFSLLCVVGGVSLRAERGDDRALLPHAVGRDVEQREAHPVQVAHALLDLGDLLGDDVAQVVPVESGHGQDLLYLGEGEAEALGAADELHP